MDLRLLLIFIVSHSFVSSKKCFTNGIGKSISNSINQSYRHVILMHGILAGPTEMDCMQKFIAKAHPGTNVTVIKMYDRLSSLDSMWTQVGNITAKIKPIMKENPEGVHMICFSQGGLICRAIIQSVPDHNVVNFIGLSSPLAGQYGDTNYLKYLFPRALKETLYEILYSNFGQRFSIGNYWNDPYHQPLFKKFSNFLAILNNDTAHPKSQEYKNNFLMIKNLVLIGGPDDGVITPWQSSQFGFFQDHDEHTVINTKYTKWYHTDSFGLQTLDKRGSLHTYSIPGVKHITWHDNSTVFDCCIKQWLT
ncbi:unnamed protein product [Owenia fusiformis]|uniref:palmitoyl-CoA hydrolase n=1 Tax=Owenia fusiformis TaxID=6347 RepID=A0A8S4NW80_OWEFU|nr:unnamed protein product [Owenia fusiformis]